MHSLTEKRASPRVSNFAGLYYSFTPDYHWIHDLDEPYREAAPYYASTPSRFELIDLSNTGACLHFLERYFSTTVLPAIGSPLTLYIRNMCTGNRLQLDCHLVRKISSTLVDGVSAFGVSFNKPIDAEGILDDRNFKRPLVLIIDDEDVIRCLCAEELSEEEGYNCIIAAGGYEGLAKCTTFQPDVVVLDIRMEDSDGLDVLTVMRKQYPNLPIILNTAYDSYRADVKSLGADYYVCKSWDLAELKARIQTVLRESGDVMTNSNLVTELKSQIASLREEIRILRESRMRKVEGFAELQTLVHGWIHDLSSKLIRLHNSVRILMEKPDHPDAKSVFESIPTVLKEIDESKQELYEYLDYGVIRYEPVKMVALAKGCVERQQKLAKRMDIKLKNYCDGEIEVLGNRSQLTVILDNIIDNAITYSNGQTDLKVVIKQVTRQKKRFLSIGIVNGGQVISLSKIHNIHKSVPLKTGDKGLGFPLSKYLTQRHKGTMTIRRTKQGTAVTVLIPILAAKKR